MHACVCISGCPQSGYSVVQIQRMRELLRPGGELRRMAEFDEAVRFVATARRASGGHVTLHRMPVRPDVLVAGIIPGIGAARLGDMLAFT